MTYVGLLPMKSTAKIHFWMLYFHLLMTALVHALSEPYNDITVKGNKDNTLYNLII